MLKSGTRVTGIYEGYTYVGVIREYNHITSIDLDISLMINGEYRQSIYVYMDTAHGCLSREEKRNQGNTLIELPDLAPGRETDLQPLCELNAEYLAKEFKGISLSAFRAKTVDRLTTWKTVKKSVECEYGHKHIVDTRVKVLPVINDRALNWDYLWFCLAEYAAYTERRESMRKMQTWHWLASKLSLGGGAFHYGTSKTKQDWQGLDPATVKRIKDDMLAQYTAMCTDYKNAIFGPIWPRGV